MAEDAVVEMFFMEAMFEVDNDTFAVVAEVVEHIFFCMLTLVAVAPTVGDTKSKTRGQHLEKPLAEAAAEEHPHEVEPLVCVTKSVAMAYKTPFAVEFKYFRFIVDDGAKFLGEVVEHPHVVVAKEEVYLDAAVGQLGQLAEEACVATRHQMTVGEPEIEDIAQEHEFLAARLYLFKEKTKLPLALEAILATAQMCIRYKKDLISSQNS